LGEEYPCPERLRTGCYPDEEFLGLLRLVPPEQLGQPELAPQVQQEPQPSVQPELVLQALLVPEPKPLERMVRPEPVLKVQPMKLPVLRVLPLQP
jgi:hypothetical protein